MRVPSGICSRGKTCPYKHDPSKIAICWPFLQGVCQNTAETCPLSHNPTPERTPLCVHFAKNGRCKNGDDCLFPHVHTEPRHGVCRDFAVLGYCDRGVDCDKQHVRECPDFAEHNSCPNPKCKLPHVIRANRRTGLVTSGLTEQQPHQMVTKPVDPSTDESDRQKDESAEIGDEYISLTFHESGESEDGEDLGEVSDEQSGDEEDDDMDMEVHI